jgi:WhiB family transcriptional regulator, redox-sensing transcriptional regulator
MKVKVPVWDGGEPCASVGLTLFYNDDRKTQYQNKELERELKSICAGCHRLNECREYAINHEYYGFWGGMTNLERKAYRKAYKIELVRPEMYSECLPEFARGNNAV